MIECTICGKEFSTKEELGGHMSGHSRHGEKRPDVGFCVYCGKKLLRSDTKYCSNKCQVLYQQADWEKRWLSGEIAWISDDVDPSCISKRIRRYLFDKYDNKCARCGWGIVNPYTNKLPLEVDHIDGNYKNNSPDNLILLCPNCHSLTRTYKGANRGNGRSYRTKS